MLSNTEIRQEVEKTFIRLTTLVTGASTEGWEASQLSSSITQMADWLTTQNDLDETTDTMEDLISDYLDSLDDILVETDDDDLDIDHVWVLTTRGCDATGVCQDDGRFTVFAGSIGSGSTTDRFINRHPGSFRMRNDLLEQGIFDIEDSTGSLQVMSDVTFDSPARAASVLAGDIRGTDAWILVEWVHE